MRSAYRRTLAACYTGYVTQAIVNNLSPLLFLTFNKTFGISLERIALLISANFAVQTVADLCSAKIVGRLGVRASVTAAHVFAAAGLAGMGIFPYILPDRFAGLILSAALCAAGGGLIEVLISPIVDSLPSGAKASAMSLLHSFYCWGQMAVVLLSTLFFTLVGVGNWRILTFLWAAVPFANIFLFINAPIRPFTEEGEEELPLKKLFGSGTFLLLFALMISAGASELAVSQWASLFAEAGLGVSKTAGDLLGPCMFAALMGSARLCYGIWGKKIKLAPIIAASSVLCVFSYGLTVFSPIPQLSLAGCGLCGLSVGIMWPGVFSLASEKYSAGGTGMFAALALAGDIGCLAGPALVGVFIGASENGAEWISRMFPSIDASSAGLKTGLIFAEAFPLIMLAGVSVLSAKSGENREK